MPTPEGKILSCPIPKKVSLDNSPKPEFPEYLQRKVDAVSAFGKGFDPQSNRFRVYFGSFFSKGSFPKAELDFLRQLGNNSNDNGINHEKSRLVIRGRLPGRLKRADNGLPVAEGEVADIIAAGQARGFVLNYAQEVIGRDGESIELLFSRNGRSRPVLKPGDTVTIFGKIYTMPNPAKVYKEIYFKMQKPQTTISEVRSGRVITNPAEILSNRGLLNQLVEQWKILFNPNYDDLTVTGMITNPDNVCAVLEKDGKVSSAIIAEYNNGSYELTEAFGAEWALMLKPLIQKILQKHYNERRNLPTVFAEVNVIASIHKRLAAIGFRPCDIVDSNGKKLASDFITGNVSIGDSTDSQGNRVPLNFVYMYLDWNRLRENELFKDLFSQRLIAV